MQQILGQVPAAIATITGPEHRYSFLNDTFRALAGHRARLGLSTAEVFPELAGQGFIALLDQVYATGQPFVGTEVPIQLAEPGGEALRQLYLDFLCTPLPKQPGQPAGVLVFILDVTEKVRTRQQNEALQAEVLAAAQRRAQERESFYQVFDQTAAAVSILRGARHRFDYVNPAIQHLFAGRQLVGLDFATALPDAAARGFVALLDQVYRTGETFFGNELPFTPAPAAGQVPHKGYFNFTYQAMREAGATVGISIFAYDVTEQVLARQERETQRQRLLGLFQETPAGICILVGAELVFEFADPGYQQILPGRALLGRSVFEAMPQIVGTPVETLLRQVYATGQTHEVQGALVPVARPADGVLEDRYFTFVYQGRRDEQGHVDGIMVFAFEVTEQVQARQAAEASARQLRLLTDALPVLIGYLDRERRYRFANEAYRTWFGQDPATLLGQQVHEVVGEKAFAATQAYMERALAGERVNFEAIMPYREGFTRYVRISFIPDAQRGAVLGFYTLVTDITEQVEARRQVEGLNQELGDSNQQLTRTNVDLDNFIYTASHDLKAPITNIEGLLDTLRHELPEQPPTGKVAYILDLMQDSVERFQRTIEHLTTVSKLQKEHDLPTVQVLLAPVLEDVRLDLAPLLQQTGGRLHVRVQNCPPLQFSEKNLRSIVYNLLSNALKYRHPDRVPEVHVRCH